MNRTKRIGLFAAASSATNFGGSNLPVNITPPSISGTARKGSVLTYTQGTWSG